MVNAGPGTGKTRTVVARAAWLVAAAGYKPEDLLVLTFTNKAAGELKTRLGQVLGKKVAGAGGGSVRACTIHKFCYDTLR